MDVRKEVKKRNSSIELLRIFAIVLTFWTHSAGSYVDNELSAWISVAVETLGSTTMIIFTLLSGYYGIKFNAKKLLQLEFTLLFYAWTALAMKLVCGTSFQEMGIEQILTYLLPSVGKFYWYFTFYFVLVFISPFLNEYLERISKERFLQMLAVMLVLFSGVTTIFFFDIIGDAGKGIVNMVMIYCIGRYIRMYLDDKKFERKKLVLAFLAVYGVCVLLNLGLYLMVGSVQNRYGRINTLFTITEGVLIFLIFKGIYFENRFVNRIASYMPAVLLMEWTVKESLIHFGVNFLHWADTNWHQLVIFVLACLILIFGSAFEWLRQRMFGGVEKYLIDKICEAGEKLWTKILVRYQQRGDGIKSYEKR